MNGWGSGFSITHRRLPIAHLGQHGRHGERGGEDGEVMGRRAKSRVLQMMHFGAGDGARKSFMRVWLRGGMGP